MKRSIRTVLAPVIMAATVVAFAYYIAHHHQVLVQLRHLPPGTLAILLMLYAIVFVAFAWVTRASLHMFNKTMGPQENILFNAYSSLINFFGPGQSGPVFRGAYLKKRHQLSLKHYAFATLLYYGFFAVLSVFIMLAGVRPWWQTTLVVAMASVVSVGIIRWYKKRRGEKMRLHMSAHTMGLLCAATALQVLATAVIYGVELHNVGAHVSVGQVLAYSGVANLALFVSITPGAIGIREFFLSVTQRLHHIDGSTIVSANVVDRGAYLVFLGILFILVISMHAKQKLRVAQLTADKQEKSRTR